MTENKVIKPVGGDNLSNPDRYDCFDGLRAIAAFGIAIMHYLANIDKGVAEILKEGSFLYGALIPTLTTFVFMFFTLSAFSMCCGYFGRFQMVSGSNGSKVSGFDTEKFYSKRYSRIWPFFALLVMIDLVMNPSMEELYQCFADLTLAFNLLPNPEIHVIGVGWFLGVVFVFYMIFPWFVFLLQNKKRAWMAMAVALVMHYLCVYYFLTEEFVLPSEISNFRHNIVWSFPYFMVGGIMYLYRAWLREPKFKMLWLVLAVGSTVGQFAFNPKILGDNYMYLLVVFCLWIMYAMTGGFAIGGVKLLDNKVMKFFGGLSMEIYLCHMVMFRVVEKLHLEKFIENPHLLYWVWCVVGIAVAVVFSWVVKNWVFPFCYSKWCTRKLLL